MQIEQDYINCNVSDRDGYDIDLVVIHHTSSFNIDGTVSWFKDRQSKASAHYVIGLDGRIIAMVPEDKKAWHAGKSLFQGEDGGDGSVNKFSIGIELVGDGNQKPYPDEQYDALIELCCDIKSRYGIPDERFTGHEFIAPKRKNDPGNYFDWKRFMRGICNNQTPSFIQGSEPDSDGYKEVVKDIAITEA